MTFLPFLAVVPSPYPPSDIVYPVCFLNSATKNFNLLLAEFASIGSPVQPAEQGTEAD